jgi:hypothetical protein
VLQLLCLRVAPGHGYAATPGPDPLSVDAAALEGGGYLGAGVDLTRATIRLLEADGKPSAAALFRSAA